MDLSKLCALSATLALALSFACLLNALSSTGAAARNQGSILLAFNLSTLVAAASLCMLLVQRRQRASSGAAHGPLAPWLWMTATVVLGCGIEAAVRASRLQPAVDVMLAAEVSILAVVACGLWCSAPEDGLATDRRLRQTSLDAGRLAAVLACSSDGLIAVSPAGRVTGWNSEAERMLGWKAAEAIGRSAAWAPPPERAVEEGAMFERLRRGGQVERYETKLQRKDGGTVDAAVTASPIFDGSGTVVGVLRAVRNLTLVEDRQARLRRRRAELAHLSRIHVMNDLSAAVAHEINQPLTAITNLVGVARTVLGDGERTPEPEGLRNAARAIGLAGEQALRAGEIIGHVRAFIASGDVDVHAERLDQIVEEALSLALLTDDTPQIRLRKSLTPNLEVWADRIQIEQVIVNLVNNAIEAMRDQPADTRGLTVTAGLSADQAFAEVSVVDTGPGVPTRVADQPSTPSRSEKPKGLGVGLSISRRIILAHGGRLSSVSEAAGAAFHFTIPLARGEALGIG